MKNNIKIKFEYIDKDHEEHGDFDTVMVAFPLGTNLEKLNKDFAYFSENYMRGYTLGEELSVCETEEDFVVFEKEYGLSRAEAEYFAEVREDGLSGYTVVSTFLEKYPEYQGEIEDKYYHITFNEYDGCDVVFGEPEEYEQDERDF